MIISLYLTTCCPFSITAGAEMRVCFLGSTKDIKEENN